MRGGNLYIVLMFRYYSEFERVICVLVTHLPRKGHAGKLSGGRRHDQAERLVGMPLAQSAPESSLGGLTLLSRTTVEHVAQRSTGRQNGPSNRVLLELV
jgi:hypothetical protein